MPTNDTAKEGLCNMIESLHIKNFKGWKDTGNIKFAPITLFMGSNSSGKSSIGQFLMLLKQSSVSPDRRTVLFLGDSDSVVELGGPVAMLHNHNMDEMLEFEYTWTLPKPLKLAVNAEDQDAGEDIKTITFLDQIKVHNKEVQTLEVENMRYTLLRKDASSFSVGMDRVQKGSSARAYKAITQNYDIKRVPGRAWEMPSPYRFYGFPEEMITYHKNAYFIPQINAVHENLFSRISYLGPLREKAERHYRWTGFIPGSVGPSGKDCILALLAARTEKRKFNFKPKQPYISLEEVIAKALKDMGLVEEFVVQRVSEDRQDYEVKVRTKGSRTLTDVPDVGFGISQVLPVLVQLYYAPANSIIIMEQPELHLHPKAQSALADIMIEAIFARENAKPRNVQLIIETHSEHFLRRFQRRIAEKKLEESQFAAYFANSDVSPTKLEALEVNLFGEIINWPENFFGDLSGDIFAQTSAAIERQISGE